MMIMDKHSYLSNANGEVIEDLYNQYLVNKNDVEEGWRKFFDGFEFARKNYDSDGDEIPLNVKKEFMVIKMIDEYRSRGHLFTKTNPVRERRKYSPSLKFTNFGLEESDLKKIFQAGDQIGIGPTTLQNIIDHLEETYCESIGIEYQYIRHPNRVRWIRDRIEIKNRPVLSIQEKKQIMHKLNQATVFEQFYRKNLLDKNVFRLKVQRR